MTADIGPVALPPHYDEQCEDENNGVTRSMTPPENDGAPSVLSTVSTSSTLTWCRTMDQYRRGLPPAYSDRTSLCGFLRMRHALREWRMKTWYCVCYKAQVYWYTSKRDAIVAHRLQGRIHVASASVSDGKGKLHTYAHAFVLTTVNGQIYFCAAASEAERMQWINHVNAIEKHHRPCSKSQRNTDVPITGASTISSSSTESSQPPSDESITSISSSNVSGSKPPAGKAYGMGRRRRPWNDNFHNKNPRALNNEAQIQTQTTESTSCYICEVEFHTLRRHRHICQSCSRAFCRWHRSKEVILSSRAGGSRWAKVCHSCAYRQHFINFVEALTSRTMQQVNDASDVVSAIYGSDDSGFSHKQEGELKFIIAKPANFTTLNMLCLLKKYLGTPRVCARILCVFILLFENDIQGFEDYWVQFLGIYVPLIRSLDRGVAGNSGINDATAMAGGHIPLVFKLQNVEKLHALLQLYISLVVGICRRSIQFALRTVWECQARYEDARLRDDLLCANYMLLLIYLVSSFNGNSELVAELWLKDAPVDQAETMVHAMDELMYANMGMKRIFPDTLVAQWIHAQSRREIQLCSRIVAAATDSSTNLSPNELLELFAPVSKEATMQYHQFLGVAMNHSLDNQSFEETAEDDEAITRTQEQIFNDEAEFVYNLTSLADHLRLAVPVSERMDVLPCLLQNLQDRLPPAVDGRRRVYLPLSAAGTSTQVLEVVGVVPAEGKVFSTRCRAPTMIVFEAITSSTIHGRGNFAESMAISNSESLPVEEENIKSIRSISLESRKLNHQDSQMLDDLLCRLEEEEKSIRTAQGHQAEIISLAKPSTTSSSSGSSSDDIDDDEAVPEQLIIEEARLVYEESTYGSMRGVLLSEALIGGRSETWEEKSMRIKYRSEFKHFPGWTLVSIVAKSFDDLRQEVFAMQLMTTLQAIFQGNDFSKLYLRPYKILCTGANVGLIETLTDSLSIDALKQQYGSLQDYFSHCFGQVTSDAYIDAQQAFISSMAASSVFCYLFQIKDRHNGNIMMDHLGHIIHIDFGFMLGIAPGGRFSVEDAPFKLTMEMVDLMGGTHSKGYKEFCQLFLDGMLAVRREYIKLLSIIHLTITDSPFPCFQHQHPAHVLHAFRQRLFLHESDDTALYRFRRLIDKSYNHWGTRQYDKFQFATNGILP